MKKLNLKKIITMGLITTSILAAVPVGASAAWKQDGIGKWYTKSNNAYATGWEKIDGPWYYFDSNGYMKKGWLKDGNNWYYLETSGWNEGTMVSGTHAIIDGKESMFKNNGVWNGYANHNNQSNSIDTFTMEEALQTLKDPEVCFYHYGVIHENEVSYTSGGYNGLPVEDKVYTIDNGEFGLSKYRLFGVIDNKTGKFLCIARVMKSVKDSPGVGQIERGYCLSNGSYIPGEVINEATFDKNGTIQAEIKEKKADAAATAAYLAENPNHTTLTREQADEDNMMAIYAMHPEYKIGHEAEYKALEEKILNRNK